MTSPARPFGRSSSDFTPLRVAEAKLVESCRTGEMCVVSTVRPEQRTEDNAIRATFLRFLALGGDDQTPVHEHGVQVSGAWIEDPLDLAAAFVPSALDCNCCAIEQPVVLRDSRLFSLRLSGCHLPGIIGDGMHTRGNLFLDGGFRARGQVNLSGTQIGGDLTCSGGSFDGHNGDALTADNAVIGGSVFLSWEFKAEGTVNLTGTQIGGDLMCGAGVFGGTGQAALLMSRAVVKGSLFLTEGFEARATVALVGAQIDGDLACEGAFNSQNGNALWADGAAIKGSIFLGEGFKATGTVNLSGTQIGGDLVCDDGSFDGKDSSALRADGAVIRGNVDFDGGFGAVGQVTLLGTQIGGDLTCSGGSFDGHNNDALTADNAVIGGNVSLDDGFTAAGGVSLLGTQIGGDLTCSGGSFDGHNGDAISACAVIKGNVNLREGFKAEGTVDLSGTQIGGDLTCSGGSFDGHNGDALTAQNTMIKGNVFLSEDFKAMGGVRLPGAQIGGILSCRGGSFDGKDGSALRAEGSLIKSSVFFSGAFTTKGTVSLHGAQIGGDLVCTDGSFDGPLILGQVDVRGTFFLFGLTTPACVDLSSATVERLCDREEAWGRDFRIDGFEYRSLTNTAPTDARTRLRWLDRQPPEQSGLDQRCRDFRPQPWRQLYKVLQEMGHVEDARQVSIAFEHRLRAAGLIGLSPSEWHPARRLANRVASRTAHCLFGWFTGYGHRPMRLVAWAVAAWLVFGLSYWFAASKLAVFAPTNPLVFQNDAYLECRPDRKLARAKLEPHRELLLTSGQPEASPHQPDSGNWYLCPDLREEYSGFSPFAYSLDVLLPVVDLHQEKEWGPLIPTPQAGLLVELTAFSVKHFVRMLIWTETLFGWLASLLLIAIVSGLAKRREG